MGLASDGAGLVSPGKGASMAFRYLLAHAALLLLTAAPSANATPIGPNCGTCQGSTYEITYSGSPISSTPTTETFEITYTIDTTGYNGGGTHLDQVPLKVSSSITSGTLVSAPGGVGDWNVIMGGINASGCSMAGSGFDCAS